MKLLYGHTLKSICCGAFLLLANSMCGQSTLHWLSDGLWHPVYEVRGNVPFCFTGDDLVRGDPKDLTMLSAPAFGSGYLKVDILENRREGVVKMNGGLKFTSENGTFRFSGRVMSDVDIEDVYYVMRFKKVGSAAFVCRSLGSLKAGKPKRIEIFLRLDYEMPEQLHFYSGMEEIRTNLVPDSYDYAFGDFFLAAN